MTDIEYTVSDFVAVFNQTISAVYPKVTILGELSNFRISKNRWVYFDLKDDDAVVRFFGTVYQMPGPLEDGMMLKVTGTPQLHPRFGFSVTVQSVQLAGEGTLKRAAHLLEQKLSKEGLFDPARKRTLPYPPTRIGLIASKESAAYSDFVKVLGQRWGGLKIEHYDVQVQGEQAPAQIQTAIEWFNTHDSGLEVLIITRGGGSLEDLQAFNNEQLTRAIAASRIPTLVAVGHERDESLAERAADVRASTPSNAAELLVPDRSAVISGLDQQLQQLYLGLQAFIKNKHQFLLGQQENAHQAIENLLSKTKRELGYKLQILETINPKRILRRGYAIVRSKGKSVRSARVLQAGDRLDIEFFDGSITTKAE